MIYNLTNNENSKMRNAIYVTAVCGGFFIFLEILIRVSLFSGSLGLKIFKNPDLYGSYSGDNDYWKLYYQLVNEYKYPASDRVQSVLGWSQDVVGEQNPLGLWQESLDRLTMKTDHTKILFYGDSYIRGASSPAYEIPRYVNNNLKDVTVADLGVGGYGLDQMYLMFRSTLSYARGSHVVFGVLIDDDLDRSILSVRTGQKPHLVIKDGKLFVENVPIDPNPERYFSTNPPKIISYLFRLVSRLPEIWNVVPDRKIGEKKTLNGKIIEELHSICQKEEIPLSFILFYTKYSLRNVSWQEDFMKTKLNELGITYIDTKPLLVDYANSNGLDMSAFYVNDGYQREHHNDLGNQVISDNLIDYFHKDFNLY
jgi:hypothetical protein